MLKEWDAAIENSKGKGKVAPVQQEEKKFSIPINGMVEAYTEKEKNGWKDSKKVIVYETEQQYREFVENAWKGHIRGKVLYFGKIVNELSEKMSEYFEMDVSGFNFALYADNIWKIRKDHGSEQKEAKRGQRAIVPEDFDDIPLIIMQPDSIEKDMYNQQKGVTIRKDGFSIFMIAGSGVMNIYPQTMYASKKNRRPTPAIAEQAATNTSETTRKTSPTDSISRNEENTTKFSLEVDSENR